MRAQMRILGKSIDWNLWDQTVNAASEGTLNTLSPPRVARGGAGARLMHVRPDPKMAVRNKYDAQLIAAVPGTTQH